MDELASVSKQLLKRGANSEQIQQANNTYTRYIWTHISPPVGLFIPEKRMMHEFDL